KHQPLGFPDGGDGRGGADALSSQQSMQIVDPMDWLLIERDDDVANLEARARRRTPAFDRRDQDAAGLDESVRAHREPRQRNVLPADTDARAAHVPERDQLSHDELHRVDGYGEADPLRGENHRRVDADDLPPRIEQRATRVAGIERGVRLDDVVDQAARDGPERPPQGTHDARGDGALKSQGIADRDDDLPDPQ